MTKKIKVKIFILIILIIITVIRYMFYNNEHVSDLNIISGKSSITSIASKEEKSPIKLKQIKKIKSNDHKHENNNHIASKAISNEISEEEFVETFSKIQTEAPTKNDLSKLSKEMVHHTPEVLMNYALKLAQMKKLISSNHLYYEEGKRIYLRCTVNINLPDTIRALCINHIKELMKDQGEELDISTYPENIKYLVENLGQNISS